MEYRLDRLKTGESGTIRTLGKLDAETKWRYAALGLTKGTRVTMHHTAPSGDPISILVRGYQLSLRRSDAAKIILTEDAEEQTEAASSPPIFRPQKEAAYAAYRQARNVCAGSCGRCALHSKKSNRHTARPVRAALVGNPNCGKTTLFNAITGARESVGNWPGITVEKRERICTAENRMLRLIDLPGIYSLGNDAAEERIAREYLLQERPDLIINIVDSTQLSRNLFLTAELCRLGIPTVVALNMTDEAQAQGIAVDPLRLSELLGIPCIPISARNGTGIDALLCCACAWVEDPAAHADAHTVQHAVSDAPAAIYAAIEQICAQCVKQHSLAARSTTDRLDAVLLHRIWGIPIFLCLMGIVFFLTFDTLGAFLSDGMETLIIAGLQPWIEDLLLAFRVPRTLSSFLLSGVLGGIGGVLTFLPQVALLFFFLSLLEDSGYLARAAFLSDRTLRRFGLSGKACVPLLMGFGCTVPAALATRTMARNADRRMTLFLLPYISCSAKLPVYGMIASALFPSHRGLIVLSLYVLGIGVGAAVGSLLQGTLFQQDGPAFLLELPPYRRPTARNTLLQIADRTEHFIKRAGTLILLMNLLLWILLHLDISLRLTDDPVSSLLGRFGTWIAPLFAPLGFGSWQASVALLTGLAAKEAVTASLSMFLGSTQTALQELFTPASAYAFLVFILLSLPCAAAITTMAREWKDRRCTLLFLLLQSGVAYGTAYLAHTVLRLCLP